MTPAQKTTLYGISAVLLWSTVATAFKIALRHMGYLELLLYSAITSTVSLLAIVAATGNARQLLRYRPRDYARSALLGALNPFLYYIVLFKAYSLLPAQQAQPLNYTWPILLVVLSIPFLRQRIPPRSVLAVLVAFAGVLVISTRGDLGTLRVESPAGVALALASGLIWAVYWLINVRDGRDALVKLCLNFSFGLGFILVTSLVALDLERPSFEALAAAAYVGLFEMGLTFAIWLKALQHSPTTAQVSVLVYLTPFLSLFFIRFVLGEPIAGATVIGLVFIVGGIALQQIPELWRDRRPS